MFFCKGNKTKSDNKDALQLGRDRYSAKNYIETSFFPLILFSLVLLKDFLKICRINNLSTLKYGQKNKIYVKMYVTSFSSVLWSYAYFFKVISVLQKKRNRRNKKEVNKTKNKVMTQLLEACVSLPVSSASLVPFFIQFYFQKTFIFYFFKNRF